MEKTLIIIKPDALQRQLAGKIISEFEQKGLKIVAMKMMQLNRDICEKHYAHLRDKPFFNSIVSFMTSTPVMLMVLEGKEAVETVRKLIGITNSRQADPGSLRGRYGMSVSSNLVHASDSKESAEREIALFFKKEEIYHYELLLEKVIYSEDSF